jgi:hypothetical protein
MVRSASEFIIGPRFARTPWRVSNHDLAAILRDGANAPPQNEVRTSNVREARGALFDVGTHGFKLIGRAHQFHLFDGLSQQRRGGIDA